MSMLARRLSGSAAFIVGAFVLYGLLVASGGSCKRSESSAQAPANIRESVVDGQFYPADPKTLDDVVSGFLGNAKELKLPGKVRALIAPHAGYIYSGSVAAQAYRVLTEKYQRVFVLACNHTPGVSPFVISVPPFSHFKTPLGDLRVSSVVDKLKTENYVEVSAAPHSSHIIEVQLPFLQKVLGANFEIVPIVTGHLSMRQAEEFAGKLLPYIDDKSLVVVSSDLSHYHPYERAVNLDKSCLSSVAAQDIKKVSICEACGRDAIQILLNISQKKGWKAELLEYKNSGDTAGPKDGVVGYGAVAFYEGSQSAERGDYLLRLSRDVLAADVEGKQTPDIEIGSLPPEYLERRGCFVTLNKHGELRGCIGDLSASVPLYRCVMENTVNAARRDPRFSPVAESELPEIEIEVSVLSAPKTLERTSPDELLGMLRPLEDGVILEQGPYRATFLPQVWGQIPDKKEFLSRLCLKGGASASCWKDPSTKVSLYQAKVYVEKQN